MSPTPDPQAAPDPARTAKQLVVLAALIGLCCLIEIVLTLSDWQVIDYVRLRQRAYEYAGFWPGLLDNWRPNYAAQPATMFLTYGFLHGGMGHLIVNMITLFSLGSAVMDRVIGRGFLVIYCGSILGGAVAYALLAQTPQPMVGASGALFGLAGALLGWNYLDRVDLREGIGPVIRMAGLLIAINIVMWWALNGHLAWQTHLGGFLTGAVLALTVYRRS
ncbi:rhomboid family intramembrane serine protease [Yoonia sp. R2331]|uniref:rhomboid family intramembrane serine protease n=1 Tax=Yoonia sp. R2331 TaxID=3237238 RepID=UPI0034E47A9A